MNLDRRPADKIIFIADIDLDVRRAAVAAAKAHLPISSRLPFQGEAVIHATLVLAGHADDPRTIPTATDLAAVVRHRAFEVRFDTLGMFAGSQRILALTCSVRLPEWTALRDQLAVAARKVGVNKIGGASPHLSLAYGAPDLVATTLAEPLEVRIKAFKLVRSVYGERRHEELGRWGLQ